MKKGFTKVDNEILEALIKAELNGTEFKVLLTIIRYTFGYHRDECPLTLKYIAKYCEKSKSWVVRVINKLLEKNFIFKEKNNKNTVSYSINSCYLKEQYGGVQKDNKEVYNSTPYKDNIININNKYIKKQNDFSAKATKFSNFTQSHTMDYKKLEMDALKKKIERIHQLEHE